MARIAKRLLLNLNQQKLTANVKNAVSPYQLLFDMITF